MTLDDHLRILFGDRVAPDGSLVRQNFARWFCGSAVVDTDGRPLAVYHGTKSDFDRFEIAKAGASDEGLAGKGFYFTYNPEEASSYALRENFGNGNAPNVIRAYVSLTNPLIITNGMLPDGRRVQDLHCGISINASGGTALRKLADAGQHDGVMWVSRDGAVRHVVAFRPEQVKSAIGNSGAFLANDPELTDRRACSLASAQRAHHAIKTVFASKARPRSAVRP